MLAGTAPGGSLKHAPLPAVKHMSGITGRRGNGGRIGSCGLITTKILTIPNILITLIGLLGRFAAGAISRSLGAALKIRQNILIERQRSDARLEITLARKRIIDSLLVDFQTQLRLKMRNSLLPLKTE